MIIYELERRGQMKAIGFKVEDMLFKQIKFEALRQDKSVKEYITELIEKDLEAKKEQTQ